jgi:hypothetical protein
MADMTKLKRASRLGTPPSAEEASQNLTAPEVAPADPVKSYHRRDGRAARRTNRTLPFATRVSAEFDDRIRDIAERDGLKLVEVLEQALEAYEARKY